MSVEVRYLSYESGNDRKRKVRVRPQRNGGATDGRPWVSDGRASGGRARPSGLAWLWWLLILAVLLALLTGAYLLFWPDDLSGFGGNGSADVATPGEEMPQDPQPDEPSNVTILAPPVGPLPVDDQGERDSNSLTKPDLTVPGSVQVPGVENICNCGNENPEQ